jgi:hypothetical protein
VSSVGFISTVISSLLRHVVMVYYINLIFIKSLWIFSKNG